MSNKAREIIACERTAADLGEEVCVVCAPLAKEAEDSATVTRTQARQPLSRLAPC